MYSTARISILPKLEDGTTKPCFLCLQNLSMNHQQQQLDPAIIRQVCHYLNVFLGDFETLDQSLKQCIENQETCPNFSVSLTLCPACTDTFAKLSSLIKQLEKAQMLVDYQLQKFHKILQTCNNEEVTSGYFSNPISQLRRKLQEKCSTEVNRITHTSPKVKLEKITILQQPLPDVMEIAKNSDSEEDNWLPDNDNDEQSLPSEEEDEKNLNTQVSPLKKTPKSSANLNLSQLLIRPPITYFKKLAAPNGMIQMKCLICDTMFTRNLKKRKCGLPAQLARHLASSHVEKFFEKSQQEPVTNEQFEICCKKVFLLEFKQARNAGSVKASIKCPYCAYTTVKIARFRLHLLGNHLRILNKKILQFQQSGSFDAHLDLPMRKIINRTKPTNETCKNQTRLMEISKSLFEKTDSDSRFRCLLCQQQYLEKINIHHLIRDHPETIFTQSFSNNVADKERFQKLCMYVIKSETDLATEIKSGDSEPRFKCHLCEADVGVKRQLRFHLACLHFKTLEKRLRNLENDKSFDVSGLSKPASTEKTSAQERLFKLCKQYCVKVTAGKKKTCLLCNVSTNVNVNAKYYTYHFLTTHTDKLFNDMKLNNVSDTQFSYCCQEMMLCEFSQAKRVTLGVNCYIYTCQYCKRTFSQGPSLKRHFIAQHYQILEESLVRMQTEKIWENQDLRQSQRTISAVRDVEKDDNIKRIKLESIEESLSDEFESGEVDAGNGMALKDNFVRERLNLSVDDFKCEMVETDDKNEGDSS